MGLDCFFEKSSKSPEEPTFPEGLRLCGGMFTGHGSQGNFRGKVYVPFFSRELDRNLFSDHEPAAVTDMAAKLEKLVAEHPGQAWSDARKNPWIPAELYETEWHESTESVVSAQAIHDLARLFRAAADQHMKLVAWY